MALFPIILISITLFTVIYFILPPRNEIIASRLIYCERAILFRQFADFEEFSKWDIISKKSNEVKNSFLNEKMSVGHKFEWTGKRKAKSGSMEITHLEANEVIELKVFFGFGSSAICRIEFETKENGTFVILKLVMECGGNPLSKLQGSLFKRIIKRDIEFGLNKLKDQLEK